VTLFGAEACLNLGVVYAMNVVREVTDDKSLPKVTRKELQIEHATHASDQAKQVKIADKICNIRDIIKSPPEDWSTERKREYLDWTCKVVNGCRGGRSRVPVAR
jgi:guanosine-3',5'-bis(diphosphate) 3'-pyrophosphohydrolase